MGAEENYMQFGHIPRREKKLVAALGCPMM
jgi:hypothetical protein